MGISIRYKYSVSNNLWLYMRLTMVLDNLYICDLQNACIKMEFKYMKGAKNVKASNLKV